MTLFPERQSPPCHLCQPNEPRVGFDEHQKSQIAKPGALDASRFGRPRLVLSS